MIREYVNPWWGIPSVLGVSDRQITEIKDAQRIRRVVYSDSSTTPEQRASARRVLDACGAGDLAEMLGLPS